MCSFPRDRESVRARAHGEKNPWQRGSRLLRERNRVELALAGAAWQSDLCLPVFSCVSVGWLVVCVCVCLNLLLPPPPPLPDLLPNLLCAGQLLNCYSAHKQICHELTSVTASLEARIAAQADLFRLFSKIDFLRTLHGEGAADRNGMRHEDR